MTTADHQPAHLDPLQTRDRLLSALAAVEMAENGDAGAIEGRAARGAAAWATGDLERVRSLPPGVTAWAWLTDGQNDWLWCETAADATGMGQAVIDLPPGRYLVDTLDTAARNWSAREAAEGGPLVIGVTLTGHPVALRIRRCDERGDRDALRKIRWRGGGAVAGALFVAAVVAPGFRAMRAEDAIVPGAGVTHVARLASYLPSLGQTPGDTPVYVLQGREPGGTLLDQRAFVEELR